jgi:O-antigen biosynthesis protein
LPDAPGLEFTGERVVPGLVDPNLFNEHLARYRFAALFAGNARVLDAGCGSGYGSAELAAAAASVTAMDISAEAVAHASRTFAAPGVSFLLGSCEVLPFAEASFDLVVTFEVIEHLEHWQQLLSEARRVLRPSGVLLVSTPNKAFYTESRAAAGANPYHVHEFEYAEFQAALRAEFAHVHLWTQNHSEVIAFVPAQPSRGTFDAPADAAPEVAHFYLAACSQAPIARTSAFAWLPAAGNVLRERQRHISLLEREVARKNHWLEEAAAAQTALQKEYDKLEAELQKSNEWAAHLNGEIAKATAVIDDLREELKAARAGYERQIAILEEQLARDIAAIQDHERTIAARTEWAHSLDREMNQEREVYRHLEQQHLATQQHLIDTQAELERLRAEQAATDATRWVRLGRGLRLMNAKAGDSNG